ncbi:MAG: hypothetical protein JXR63_10615 [Spirochaetales bacterium]|nr:hypothetical protein [Spirochaetales bacterium]
MKHENFLQFNYGQSKELLIRAKLILWINCISIAFMIFYIIIQVGFAKEILTPMIVFPMAISIFFSLFALIILYSGNYKNSAYITVFNLMLVVWMIIFGSTKQTPVAIINTLVYPAILIFSAAVFINFKAVLIFVALNLIMFAIFVKTIAIDTIGSGGYELVDVIMDGATSIIIAGIFAAMASSIIDMRFAHEKPNFHKLRDGYERIETEKSVRKEKAKKLAMIFDDIEKQLSLQEKRFKN